VGLPEVVVFSESSFGGDEWRTNLNFSWVGSDWNDAISSIIVISGTWQFYGDAGFSGTYSRPLSPGYYPFVQDDFVNIRNDSISSFKCISLSPTDFLDPVTIDTVDVLDWAGTGYTGSVTVSRTAAEGFSEEVGEYPSYGVDAQNP
jgi:hypothetical protein